MIANRGPCDWISRGSFAGLIIWLNFSDSMSSFFGTRKNISLSALKRPEME